MAPLQGNDARRYPIKSHHYEPWLSKSLNTSSSSLTQVRCQSNITRSSRKHEDMKGTRMKTQWRMNHLLIKCSTYKVIHKKYEVANINPQYWESHTSWYVHVNWSHMSNLTSSWTINTPICRWCCFILIYFGWYATLI